MAKKVYIDPGHGGNDSGAIGVNNLYEKNINLEVSKKVENLLKEQGIEVRLSRSEDKTISLAARTSDANSWGADCFVSIHCNSFDGTANGIETYSHTSSTKDLANYVHEELLKAKAYTKNRGVKTANFYVIRNTNMRACLIELAFIDNQEDSKILTQKQEELADGIARGICRYLNITYTPVDNEVNKPITSIDNSDTFYRVVCGSYNNRLNAEEKIEELKEKGFNDAFIVIYNKE